MSKNISLIILLFSLLSCGVNMGDRVNNGNLVVYFLENVSQEKAIEFSKFWKDNGYVGDKVQTIQLDKEGDTYIIKLIEEERFHNEAISINEEAMLQELERELSKKVFDGIVEIQITDNTFKPLTKRM